MKDRSLSMHDTAALVDFVEESIPYLPEQAQASYHAFLEELETEKDLALSYKADTAKRLAADTWPMKKVVQTFLGEEGATLELEAIIKAVRPTTALLLKRLQKNTRASSLDQLMNSPEAVSALHQKEREELRLVRPEVRVKVWQEQRVLLEPQLQQARQELRMMQMQFERLRQQAQASDVEKEALLKKLEALEKRFYFAQEMLSLEELGVE